MKHKVYKTIFQIRRATAEEWLKVNPILRLAEPGFEVDTYKLKIGDGRTPFSHLPYIGGTFEPGPGESSSFEYVVNAGTHYEFPSVGESNVIYKAELERSLYQWDSSEAKYVLLGNSGETNVFEVILYAEESHEQAIARVVEGAELFKGDIAIVKTLISAAFENADGEDKYSYTSYVYGANGWTAMDGNVNAKNVYFDEDMLITKEFGYITLNNGQGYIPSKNKNLMEVFEAALVKEINPSITQPSVGWDNVKYGKFEVGTTVTPSWDAKFNMGSYSYGPATGLKANSWAIKNNTTTETAISESGSFADIIIADDTNYTITATATYDDASVPVTNKGNQYAVGQIKAGSKSATSAAITGYRNSFFGTFESYEELTSEAIRSLASSTDLYNKKDNSGVRYCSANPVVDGTKVQLEIPLNAKRVVIAYPATLDDIESINDRNGLGAQINSSFTKTIVAVEGKDGASAIDYKVYYIDYANPNDTVNFYDITI